MSVEERYATAMHGIQTAVAFAIERGIKIQMSRGDGYEDRFRKHLETGKMSLFVTDKAVAELLIQKGIITREEYIVQIAIEAEAELARWTERIHDAGYPGLTFG
jgi:hypothetical protein